MLLGYNTNGLAHHEPLAALELLAELGYRSVGLTIDHGLLNPFAPDLPRQIEAVRQALERHRLSSVVETGARFLLDSRLKHEPTLVSADPAARQRRIDFYRRAIDIAAGLNSDCLSIWSGIVRDQPGEATVWERLLAGLRTVIAYAAERRVTIGFEPEPGMFIDTLARFRQLLDRLGDDRLRLTLDVGHLHCQGELPIADHIAAWAGQIVNVHIEDMRAGVHDHLMFGEGEIDFPPIIAALRAIDYRGSVQVELSRHSHCGPEAARRAHDFLAPLVGVG